MEVDRELVKARAVDGLRAALLEGAWASDALRRCYYRNPMFAGVLFTEGLRQWFGLECDVRMITRFVSRLGQGKSSAGAAFPRREAEALIRAALGEVALLEQVDPAMLNYPEIGIAVLGELFSEWQPGRADVELLFDRAAVVLKEAHELSLELAPGEDAWFAAQMHESPFVFGAQTAEDNEKG
jgi:hypothetical protein